MTRLENFRAEKDEFFAHHPQSPLTREQQRVFKGLEYFAENPDLNLVVTVDRLPDGEQVEIQTTTGSVQTYTRYGKFQFSVDGQQAELTIFASDHDFFLPFVDSLAGKETYGAGRYLEPQLVGKDQFLIDFNFAYNPYCTYNEPAALAAKAGRAPMVWSCPITPFENRLKVPISAGEKLPAGEWVENHAEF